MQVLAATVRIVMDAMCGFVGRVHGMTRVGLCLGQIGFVLVVDNILHYLYICGIHLWKVLYPKPCYKDVNN